MGVLVVAQGVLERRAEGVGAAVDADLRAHLLESFRDLLDRLDTSLIEQDELDDHSGHPA
jgi:hypothetical protein